MTDPRVAGMGIPPLGTGPTWVETPWQRLKQARAPTSGSAADGAQVAAGQPLLMTR